MKALFILAIFLLIFITGWVALAAYATYKKDKP